MTFQAVLGMAYRFLGVKLLPGTHHLFLGIDRMFPGTPKLFLGTLWLLGMTLPFLGTLERFLGIPKIRMNKFLFICVVGCFLARQRTRRYTTPSLYTSSLAYRIRNTASFGF
jgi:hypothetical protein